MMSFLCFTKSESFLQTLAFCFLDLYFFSHFNLFEETRPKFSSSTIFFFVVRAEPLKSNVKH